MPKTLVVYDWKEIQALICDEMQIPVDKFRDYHEIVGGEYKDLWHVALEFIVPDNMTNNTIVRLYAIEDLDQEPEYYGNVYGEWSLVFLNAYNAVMDKLDPDFNGINVEFSW